MSAVTFIVLWPMAVVGAIFAGDALDKRKYGDALALSLVSLGLFLRAVI